MGEYAKILIKRLQALSISRTWILFLGSKKNSRLVESCRVVKIRMAAENISLSRLIFAPFVRNIVGANSKAWATIENNIVCNCRFNSEAGCPPNLDSGLCKLRLAPVFPRFFRFIGPPRISSTDAAIAPSLFCRAEIFSKALGSRSKSQWFWVWSRSSLD